MKIPKIIHQVWLGRHPMHPLMAKWHEDWKLLNPTWEVRLWREDHTFGCTNLRSEDGSLGFRNVRLLGGYEQLDCAANLSQRSNIWRYNLVAEYGGIYLDTDIEPLRPLDDSLFGDAEAFACARWNDRAILECAAFGAAPGHPWTRDLVTGLSSCDSAVSKSMGVEYFTRVAARHPGVVVLPKEAFVFDYPGPWTTGLGTRAPGVGEASALYPESRAFHHWSGHWWRPSFTPLGSGREPRRAEPFSLDEQYAGGLPQIDVVERRVPLFTSEPSDCHVLAVQTCQRPRATKIRG